VTYSLIVPAKRTILIRKPSWLFRRPFGHAWPKVDDELTNREAVIARPMGPVRSTSGSLPFDGRGRDVTGG
jgi:hypothetical protein